MATPALVNRAIVGGLFHEYSFVPTCSRTNTKHIEATALRIAPKKSICLKFGTSTMSVMLCFDGHTKQSIITATLPIGTLFEVNMAHEKMGCHLLEPKYPSPSSGAGNYPTQNRTHDPSDGDSEAEKTDNKM